jgi:hypothetical protein
MKDAALYREWKALVNMSPREIAGFVASSDGREAGTPVGQRSARRLIDMLRTPASQWTDTQWDWAKRQVAFIKRMRGVEGPLYDAKGRPTRKLLALRLWGYNPPRARRMARRRM